MSEQLQQTIENSDRIAAEQMVMKIKGELALCQKDIEQFAYAASHDLREPLRAVAGFMELLRREYQDKLDANAREYIDFAIDGATRMQNMLQDLLALSRVGTRGGEFVTVDVREILDIALANLSAILAESEAVITIAPLPKVIADPSQLSLVFQGLIANAIKFGSQRRPDIQISASHGDEGWSFAVRDNGIGIEAQYFERIFLIFQRLHPRDQYPGTGIGLAICKKIVERHGGTIRVESVPGQGSTFCFTIPDR